MLSLIRAASRAISQIIQALIRNIDGGLGERARYRYYKRKFASCGSNVRIGIGVKFVGLSEISIGDNVWIDDYCILIAGMPDSFSDREVRRRKNPDFAFDSGRLVIGSNMHAAPHCIINAFGGGVAIGDHCGLSSGVKIYSMSNHYRSKKHPSKVSYSNPMTKGLPVVLTIFPVVLGENCFVTLNASILGGTMGKNSYVLPYSLVLGNFKENSIISGAPAERTGPRFKEPSDSPKA